MAQTREVRVQVTWPRDATGAPDFVNQFMLQPGLPVGGDAQAEDTFYLLFGHAAPLIILSEEEAAQLNDPEQIVVAVRASLMLSRARMEEVWTVMGQVLGQLPGNPGEYPLPFRGPREPPASAAGSQ